MSKYLFIKAQAATWTLADLCRVLGVSRSGYYRWRAVSPPPVPGWQPAAQQAFTRHAKRYGTRRLRAELQAEGHQVGRYALRSWLRASGQRALSTRPQRPRTTQADPAAVVAENRLLGQPAPTCPNQVWVGDITYLPLVGGRWCYLATWRDACSRRVVGWHLAAQMPTELVLTALEQALTLRQPAPGLVIHADRGSQYTSHACRQRIEDAGALASYARPGNPYDNAQAEAGWSTLKTELLPHGGVFASLEEARLEVAYYLDTYFNLDRRHSALGYRSPHQFEADLFQHLP
ncbi:IS3 family transposase [Hymenobacter sp. BT186]|uniref:IS3 family transposase n=1 Tax=Hymenobacter telluris TaxID=2816474 RepID=A0A939JF69_9BACT|nr:IS3 family transposase [Hymenobacter telluris]MBO0361180.1 IS3 family transposase [Hymenobacter telluris]MBW3377208.1 IS3 family transposase [Hymenobacter norwichensis]